MFWGRVAMDHCWGSSGVSCQGRACLSFALVELAGRVHAEGTLDSGVLPVGVVSSIRTTMLLCRKETFCFFSHTPRCTREAVLLSVGPPRRR